MSGCGLGTLQDIAEALGLGQGLEQGLGPGSGQDSLLSGVDPQTMVETIATDSRQLAPGALFIAIRGQRFDGHDHVAAAREAGAVAAVVDKRQDDPLPQLLVGDTRLALGLLGRARRRAWGGAVVAVTGNSGKTTVKQMLATLLARSGKVLATRGNLNNDIGAPLTLLSLQAEHQHAVVELGANHIGEIAWTAMLAEPQVAVITNVTGAHVGEFGGMGRIAQAKGEILAGLPVDGIAVLNRDDDFFPLWQCLAAPRVVIDFSLVGGARLVASDLACDELGRYAFTLTLDGLSLGHVQLSLLGRHNVANALAAAAAGLAIGLSAEDVVAGLAAVGPVAGRLVIEQGIRGSRLLDDTYNANPGAVKAAMDTLVCLPGPHWCLLGAIGELGEAAEQLHADIGRYARGRGIDFLGTLGDAAQAASRAFGEGGYHFSDQAALVDHVQHHLPNNASVLIKGSRSVGMERIVAALRSDVSR